jgi:adenine-specific DNA-methyltransferase
MTASRGQQRKSSRSSADSATASRAGSAPPTLPRHSTPMDRSFEEMTREELLDYVQRQAEAGVRITFSGKDVARKLRRKVQPRSSRRVTSLSIGSPEDQARNQLIEGENLQAMVTMYRDRGQVDLILTDPPYNTGEDFRYNDRWEEDPNDPGIGHLIPEDDLGRHTYWMRFMWPRLEMMKDMLKPSGILAICIDHRELFRLGQMLDELFDYNRIAIINWQKRYAPRSDQKHVSAATEYVLVYTKTPELAKTGLLPRTEAANSRYLSPDNDPRRWKPGDAGGPKARTHLSMLYAIESPFTGEPVYPAPGQCWRSERKDMKKWLEEWGSEYVEKDIGDAAKRAELAQVALNAVPPMKALVLKGSLDQARARALAILERGNWPRLFFGFDGQGRARLKYYLEDVKKGIVPTTYWAADDYDEPLTLDAVSWGHRESGHSQSGIDELDAIVGRGHGFTTVKPLKLFTKIIQLWCPPDGLVMDPFAGSGTTGHAVLALNFETGSNRRFALIEQGRPERGDSYARVLTADRLRRVVTGDWAAGQTTATGGGFSFHALQNKVDAKAVLGMERDEMTDAVIASYFDSSRRGAPGLINMSHEGYQYLVARNTDDEGFYLVWSGPDVQPLFTEEVYEAVVKEALKAQLKPFYHVYARFNLYQSDDVRFYQIPDRILMDFGLNTSTDSFHNEESED